MACILRKDKLEGKINFLSRFFAQKFEFSDFLKVSKLQFFYHLSKTQNPKISQYYLNRKLFLNLQNK